MDNTIFTLIVSLGTLALYGVMFLPSPGERRRRLAQADAWHDCMANRAAEAIERRRTR